MQASSALPAYDPLLQTLADYVVAPLQPSPRALAAAQTSLLDALGCAFGALQEADCRRVLDTLAAQCPAPAGLPVPGSGGLRLDPCRAAFAVSHLVRWLDFSDTTFWGSHPSDNLGAVLVAAALRERRGLPVTVADLLRWLVQVYEIHGALVEANRFDSEACGLDNVLCAKIASAAVAALILGGDRAAVLSALSHAWIDGQGIPAYRHAPNTGPRKAWAAADAAARGLWFAQLAVGGEPGCPTAISAQPWGFAAQYLNGALPRLGRELGEGIMAGCTILKLVPGQRNGSTAIEAALRLHPAVAPRLDEIAEVLVHTHDEAIRRIDKAGPLPNPEARDHCLQYMVSAALVYGRIANWHYSDEAARHPQLEPLRAKVRVIEDAEYSRGHHDPQLRNCANAVEVVFAGGETTPRVECLLPAGDPRQGEAGGELLAQKFAGLSQPVLGEARTGALQVLFADVPRLRGMPLSGLLDLLA